MIFCIDISEADPRAFSGIEYLERDDRVIFFDSPTSTYQIPASIFETIVKSGCALEYVRSRLSAFDAMKERIEPEIDGIKTAGETIALIGSKKGIKKTANKLRSRMGSVNAVTTAATLALGIAQCTSDGSKRAKALQEKTQSIYFEERYAATIGSLKTQLSSILSSETRETQNAAAAMIRVSRSRQDVYLSMISRFGTERGRELYRAIRPELSSLSAKLMAAPCSPAHTSPQKKKSTDPMRLRVAGLLADETDETVDGVIEILNADREREKVCIALTKCFGQAMGVDIYKKIRDNMADIFPQKRTARQPLPQKTERSDPTVCRVRAILPNESEETIMAAADLLQTCSKKQALYLGMVKLFGADRGRDIYRAVRSVLNDIQASVTPKTDSTLHSRVASAVSGAPDEVIERIAEILRAPKDRQSVYLDLTKEFGQKNGVTLYKSIRTEMADIIPQKSAAIRSSSTPKKSSKQKDQLKQRLIGIFKNESKIEIDTIASILKAEKGRQAVYQKMVDRFGTERGRAIYRAIRKDLSDIMPKGV